MFNIKSEKNNSNSLKHKDSESMTSILQVLASLFVVLFFVTSIQASPKYLPDTTGVWVGTWSTAPQLVEPHNLPPQPGLSNNTIRQVVCVSIGGERLRIRFTNEFSKSPVVMKSVHIAISAEDSTIKPQTDKEILFGGEPETTIEPGAAVTSDPIDFSVEPRTKLALTIYFGETSPDVTGHPGSRTTSFILPGNEVSKVNFANAVKTEHWYIINTIDVLRSDGAAAVAVLGNSITDGRGSGTNKQNRWPDELAIRLLENSGTKNIGVLNEGIGGNCVLRNCLGPSAESRFERDVLNQNGVRWLIILEGINDIGGIRNKEMSEKVAKGLIAAYEKMIDRAHAKGIRVFGATLTPFAGSFYDSPERQVAWKTVNEWIRHSGKFDAVIDLDAAMEDPANPMHMLPVGDSGDHLHPNETGHKMMGDAVDLNLFK